MIVSKGSIHITRCFLIMVPNLLILLRNYTNLESQACFLAEQFVVGPTVSYIEFIHSSCCHYSIFIGLNNLSVMEKSLNPMAFK